MIATNEKMNSLAWESSRQNDAIADFNVSKAVLTMDEAMETLQVAMVLLNTVEVDQALLDNDVEAERAKQKPADKSMFSRKEKA